MKLQKPKETEDEVSMQFQLAAELARKQSSRRSLRDRPQSGAGPRTTVGPVPCAPLASPLTRSARPAAEVAGGPRAGAGREAERAGRRRRRRRRGLAGPAGRGGPVGDPPEFIPPHNAAFHLGPLPRPLRRERLGGAGPAPAPSRPPPPSGSRLADAPPPPARPDRPASASAPRPAERPGRGPQPASRRRRRRRGRGRRRRGRRRR
eukprot:tig00021126_g18478.t1